MERDEYGSVEDRLEEYQNLKYTPSQIAANELVIVAEELVALGDREGWEIVSKKAMQLDPRLDMFSRIPSFKVRVNLPLDHQAIREAMQNPGSDQLYYWTPQWQADEKEADDDIKNLSLTSFKSPEEAINYLKTKYPTNDA